MASPSCCGGMRRVTNHQVLELERPLGHIVALAPLLDTGNIVVDL